MQFIEIPLTIYNSRNIICAMTKVKKKFIDWDKTAKNLKLLRNDNLDLRRYVCSELNYGKSDCSGDCDNCKFEMDHNISQTELAKVFRVSESMVANWENGKSRPSLDDLIFYSDICKIGLYDIIVFA